ncbi:MAG TPA: DNA primase [Verrucomicrobiota bacterium]|nr:DNA primase [Verrucomicrobiota bacterium]HRT09167.1 DNA primase [Candidatus Paceibacterota bacterium]HRT57550.1 DNA primase [Candidatus Paceibacterota bacterium]
MAGLFSSATLEQVRAASDIVDVIGSYLPLKRAGANFVALCPFHKEKTPSFHVNPHRQIFHCFGCHKGGDVFAFVREYENLDFPEAVRRLAERARIPLEYESSPDQRQSRSLKEKLLHIHEQITQRWQGVLGNEAAGAAARDYLERRGVPAEAVKLFRLGAAPDAWDDTVNWARSKGFDLEDMEKAGLVLRKEGTDRFYDRFRGRLIFPICDEQGRVIGFSGRVLAGDEKTAKYVNSPETPIFVKSRVFYGLDKSKRAIIEAGFAIVCEGQLDLIACFMAGLQNVVAPQGTAFTADHARILSRYASEVVLCFDSDEAGQNAAARSLDSLLSSGLAIRVARVPSPHDPDSFIKASGGTAFKQLIEHAPGFFDYYLDRLCALHPVATDKGRLAVLRGMAEAVLKTGNQVLVDKYAQKTGLRLGVTPDAVRAEFRKLSRARRAAPAEAAEPLPEPAPNTEPPPAEYWLLKLLLLHEELIDWAARNLRLEWLQHRLVRQVLARRFQAHQGRTWTSLPAFLDCLEEADARALVTRAVAEERPLPNPAQQLADLACRLRNQDLDRQLAILIHRASQPEVDEAQRLELLRQREALRACKLQPLEPLTL